MTVVMYVFFVFVIHTNRVFVVAVIIVIIIIIFGDSMPIITAMPLYLTDTKSDFILRYAIIDVNYVAVIVN